MAAPSVTARVLSILDVFRPERPELALSEIAHRSGLALSTAHRLIAELRSWGALERADDGRYRIGLRLWEVGALAPRGVGLRDAALPLMGDVYEATQQNVQLAVRDGAEAVYVDRLSGPNAVHMVTRTGGRLPLHATGVGLVLLAHAPLQVRQQVLAEPLAAMTRHTVTDPTVLRRVLHEVRQQGYAMSNRQIEEISLSVAAPVRDAHGEVVAALSIVIPYDWDWRSYLPTVLTAARGISRTLGAVATSVTPSRVRDTG